ncbi:uncharacterized protein PV07_02861 [Cladophialophora immunda]|uniref:Uncharacterized protein n=1 Tax=Cladophialophora immunda TaxID=569365 RepID=A0A0D2CJ74_9EURO|nr:uncharacterized protein PV07_02861 [Cladophialophora immunda]KIW31193.1 hypothetical protein PV07_02861 [Cladophialophora immunda]
MPNSIPDEVQQDLERMGRLMVETFDFAIESGFLTNLFTEARRRLVEGMPACDTAGSTDTVPGGNTQAGLDVLLKLGLRLRLVPRPLLLPLTVNATLTASKEKSERISVVPVPVKPRSCMAALRVVGVVADTEAVVGEPYALEAPCWISDIVESWFKYKHSRLDVRGGWDIVSCLLG